MKTIQLGKSGVSVSRIGLGTMSMGGSYGAPDDRESRATLEMAFESGVNFFDSADFYGAGHSEEVLGEFIKDHDRSKIFVSVKIGPMLLPGGGYSRNNGNPDYIKSQLAYDLHRLKTDYIDLYFPSRIDKTVPLEDQIGALVEMKEKGFIRYIGLSEVSAETVRKAHAIHPITAVQTEYSLWTRDPEGELLSTLRELGIALVGYAPLSRGFLGGEVKSPQDFQTRDFRRMAPRFQGENFDKNLALADRLKEIAKNKGITPAQLAIAWVLAQGDDIVSLVGTKSRKHLQDSLGADRVQLSRPELEEIEKALPKSSVSGERYPAPAMKQLNG